MLVMVRQNNISISELRKRYEYEPDTGRIYSRRTGRLLQSLDDGYVVLNIGGAAYRGHRVAWALYYGEWPNGILDHEDRNRSNNRIKNLRIVTQRENQYNRVAQRNNKSGYKGVSRRGKRWRAQIEVNSKNIHLGYYDTPEMADKAYRLYEAQVHRIENAGTDASNR